MLEWILENNERDESNISLKMDIINIFVDKVNYKLL